MIKYLLRHDNFDPLACFQAESKAEDRPVGLVRFYPARPSAIQLDTLLASLTKVEQVYSLRSPILKVFCNWIKLNRHLNICKEKSSESHANV